MNSSPNECKECCYEKVCGGGAYAHRYDSKYKDFARKSIYCSAIKYFYKDVLKYFLNNGYSKEKMVELLNIY